MFEYVKNKNKSKNINYISTKSIDLSKTYSQNKYNSEMNESKEKLIINHKKLMKSNLSLNNLKSNVNLIMKKSKKRSISPINKDINIKRKEINIKNKKIPITMPNSVLDSPSRSYNKIISNLKTEFDEITRKTQSKDSKEKNNQTTSLNNYGYSNSRSNIFKNKDRIKKIRIKDYLFKPIKRKIQNNEKTINNCSINNIFLGTNITFDRNLSLIKENNFSLLGKNQLNEKNNEKIIQELKDCKLAISLLKEYIKIQIEVYSENSKKYNKEYIQCELMKKIKILEEEVKELLNYNKKLKLTCFKLLYFIESNYDSTLEREKIICKNVSQLLKENIYLRELSNSVTLINKGIINKNSNFELNESLKEYSNHSFLNRIKMSESFFSKLLNNDMGNTIKKDNRKRDKSRIRNIKHKIKKNILINSKGPSFKKRKIGYNKKVNT
jgi:hypothetical protein